MVESSLNEIMFGVNINTYPEWIIYNNLILITQLSLIRRSMMITHTENKSINKLTVSLYSLFRNEYEIMNNTNRTIVHRYGLNLIFFIYYF